MKQRVVLAALTVLLSVPVMAEPIRPARPEAPLPARSQAVRPDVLPQVLPPFEILTIVRSTGFDPLGHPLRRGPNYILRATDDDDREVRVSVDARTGEILSVSPIGVTSRMGPGAQSPLLEPMVPERYIHPGSPVHGRMVPMPNGDEFDEPIIYSPRPPAAVYGAPPPVVYGDPPPVIRATPMPDINQRRPSNAPDITSSIPRADGPLPPPPERFPQRTPLTEAAKPKPTTRAAVETPKSTTKPAPTPLPKRRPENSVDVAPLPPPEASKKPATQPIPH